MDKKTTRKIIKEKYGKIAAQGVEGCGCGNCNSNSRQFALSIGYSNEELEVIPEEANLSLSCGNPIASANLKKGEVVLDLGSGTGFDSFLAANEVGSDGRVIGIDITPEMVEKARENARKNGVQNIEFILAEIENLPLPDNSVDVVISNCVINLSSDKQKVFQEIYRVLKSGGRVAISDMALLKELPAGLKENSEAYTACITGAVLIDEYRRIVENAGIANVNITQKSSSTCTDFDTMNSNFLSEVNWLVSICIEGIKPDKWEENRSYKN